MPEVKFYKSSWKAVKLILLPLPFVVFSLYDILDYKQIAPIALDWLCLCFFGLNIPLGLFNLFDKRPEMIISYEGIFDRQSYGIFTRSKDRGFLKWDSIEDIYLKEYQNRSPQGIKTSKQKFICINLKPDIIKNQSSKFSKSLGLGDYNIPLMHLKNFDEQKFIHLLTLMTQASQTEKQLLLSEF